MAGDARRGQPWSARPDRWLSSWMVGVGAIYLLLAVNLGSLVVVPGRVLQFVPSYDAPLGSVAAAVSVDLALMMALELGVVGAYLLWAARRARAHAVIVPLVVLLEAVRGIAHDAFLLTARDYPVEAVYYGFVVLHLVVIATGLYAYRLAGEASE